jgi:PilZ domain
MDNKKAALRGQLASGGTPKDRRHFARYPIDESLLARPVKDPTRAIQGRVVDISRSGVSAVIAAELPIGEVLELKFALPHSPTGVLLEAAVRSRESYRYNMEFVHVHASDQAKINQSCTVLSLLA